MNPEPQKFVGICSYLKSDKFCFHLLVSQLVLYLVLNLIVILNGNAGILSQAMDSDNNLCGNDIAVLDYPFVYFVFPDSSMTYRTTCVKVCPQENDAKLSCYPNSKVPGCNPVQSIFDPTATTVIYETFPYMRSICAPQIYLYYKQVKEGIIPSSFNQLAHDAYVTRWWVFLFGVLVSSILMLFMNYVLDEYIKQSIWLFILSTITFFGFGGLYYSKQTKIASDLLLQQDALASMRLTPDYIFQNSNAPDMLFNGCIAIISISLFITLSVLLFQQLRSYEFQQFFKVLKVVDLCLDAYKVSKTRSRSFAFQMCIILCMSLGFFYFLSIHLFTCVSRIDEPILNPYNKTKLQLFTLILLMFLTASFAFQLNFIYICYSFVTSSTISRQIEYTMMSEDISKNDEFDQHFTKSAIEDLKYNIPQLAKMSVFKIIYLIPSLIVDLIYLFKKQNILENDNWFGRFYRENIRYNLSIINIELQQHNCSFKEAMDRVRNVFITNEQFSDNFEKYSSQIIMTQLFSLSAKMLSFGAVFSIFNLACNMPYFTAILYSSMLPSLIGGLMCYMICSLYISYYQTSGETIYYLSLKDYQGKKLVRQLRNKLQEDKDQ